ncbi:MAG: ATP synthase F1 subunit delta [bacterium]|nr:ATP synthase F1 subunit delta [bacterium]
MTGGEVARRYAKALVGIADRAGTLDETGAELEAAAQAIGGHADLRRVLENPRFPKPTRVRLVENVLRSSGASDLIRNFLRVVVEKDRVTDLSAIAGYYRELSDDKRGRVRAEIRSAALLDGDSIERLRKRLSEVTGKEVIVDTKQDESLIGGLTCRVGSVMMDGSIRNQLKNLREKLVVD